MSEEKPKQPGPFFGAEIPDVKGLKGIALQVAMRAMTTEELIAIGRRILEGQMAKDEYRDRQKDSIMWLIIGMAILSFAQWYPIMLQSVGML